MALKFYIIVVKSFKLKVKNFLGLIPTFVEVTGEKLVGGRFAWVGLTLEYFFLFLMAC